MITSTTNTNGTTEPTLQSSVGTTVARLQHNYLFQGHTSQGAEARAVLAQLRKFASQRLADNPLALETVLLQLSPVLSDNELGKGDKPSASEQAAFHALTLFGLHMQGATKAMHDTKVPFAAACGRLFATSDSKSIKSRFDAMQTAGDEASRLTHLRSLVTLLRSKALGFDYGRFAGDLRSLNNPARKNGVLLRWGRDFAHGTYKIQDSNNPQPTA